jgi:predicted enzyme related to lactoylglutathione lyase
MAAVIHPVKPPGFCRIILPVADIERAAAFYSVVFSMSGQRISPGRQYFIFGRTAWATR